MLPPKLGHIPGTLAFFLIAKKNPTRRCIFNSFQHYHRGPGATFGHNIDTNKYCFFCGKLSINWFSYPKYQSLTLPVNIHIYMGGHL